MKTILLLASKALEPIQGSAKFPTVHSLNTGFSGWRAAGKPIETSPGVAEKKKQEGAPPSPRGRRGLFPVFQE
jgi:hypothetical protein